MKRRVAVGLIASGLAGGSTVALRAADPTRLAAPALDGTAEIFYGDEMGFFKDAGLDADVQAMSNGEAVTLALMGGSVDIGCSECVSLVLAYKKGLPITIVAAGGMQTPRAASGMFFMRNDLPGSTGAAVNGKTIAVVGLNGFAQYGTQNWIDKTGGNSSTCKFVQLAGAQIGVALQDGRIDAAFVPEPFVSLVKKVARVITNPMAAIAPTMLSSAHFATTTWAQGHADELRRFQSAMRTTADWANKNPDKSAVILEKVARVSPDILAAAVRSYYGDRMDPGLLQPLIDVAAKYGGFASFPAAQMIYGAKAPA